MRRTFLLFFILPLCTSAQNLLVNGGFEEENVCSEYRVKCAPEGWIYTVPSFLYYFKEPARAHSGQTYIGLIGGHTKRPYHRTFVRSRLVCQLRAGKEYRLEFYVKSVHPVLDSVGVYFSPHDFLFDKRRYPSIRPSIFLSSTEKQPVRGDTGWQKVSALYKASGDEAFITLGMFGNRDITGYTGIKNENNFFIYFDDISLTPTDRNEILCRDSAKNKQEIYAQNERHEHQQRNMNLYRKVPPPKLVPAGTTIVYKIDTLIIPDVFFATNSFVINKSAILLLDSFKQKIQQLDIDSIVIYGHTDATGTHQANQELSWRRAGSVGAYLQEATTARIYTYGMASLKPVADNRTSRGRQLNRRVEIFIYKKND